MTQISGPFHQHASVLPTVEMSVCFTVSNTRNQVGRESRQGVFQQTAY